MVYQLTEKLNKMNAQIIRQILTGYENQLDNEVIGLKNEQKIQWLEEQINEAKIALATCSKYN